MPRGSQTPKQPPGLERAQVPQEVAKGSPYDLRNDRRPAEEQHDHRGRDRQDDEPSRNEPDEPPRRQKRSRSRTRSRDRDQGHPRSPSRDAKRARKGKSSRPRREQPARKNERPSREERPLGRDAHQKRLPSPERTPAPPKRNPDLTKRTPDLSDRTPDLLRLSSAPGIGYTVIDHSKKTSFQWRPEYGQPRDTCHEDLTKLLKAGAVISVRYCDFSSDPDAEVGEKFTLSSQGLIYIKEDVPFVVCRVESTYVTGWYCRSVGDRGLGVSWISESERAKYMGLATKDDPNGPGGNNSPHVQLQMTRRGRARDLKPTTHVFAGEISRAIVPPNFYIWGFLAPEEYFRLMKLHEFLTASPGSTAGRIASVSTTIGLDINALSLLRTAEQSLVRGWERQIAALEAQHKPKPPNDDTDANTRPPRAQTAPDGRNPPPITRTVAGDVSTTTPPPPPPPPPPPATMRANHKRTRPAQPQQPRAGNGTRDSGFHPPTGPKSMRGGERERDRQPRSSTRPRQPPNP